VLACCAGRGLKITTCAHDIRSLKRHHALHLLLQYKCTCMQFHQIVCAINAWTTGRQCPRLTKYNLRLAAAQSNGCKRLPGMHKPSSNRCLEAGALPMSMLLHVAPPPLKWLTCAQSLGIECIACLLPPPCLHDAPLRAAGHHPFEKCTRCLPISSMRCVKHFAGFGQPRRGQ
jgi:hypothetical protein